VTTHRPVARLRALAGLAALALSAGACGSTALTQRAAGTAGRAGSTETVAGIPGTGQAGPASAGPGSTVAGGSGSAGGGGTTGAGGGIAYKLGVPGFTQGITEDTIKIGVPVIANAQAVAGLLGAANINPGDNGLETRAMVADINARGGIHGRKIEVDYFAVDFGNPSSVEANVLAACNHFADDSKVFAILMVINPPTSFVSCAAQKGLIIINGSLSPLDDEVIAEASPWYYSPTLVSQSRIWKPLFDSVGKRGIIKPGDKVAVFALDELPFTRVADKVVIPELKARGYDVVAYERVISEASIQNAVLRFRQSGATHVVFVQASGVADLLFMRQAEAQKFRPTYLMTSYDVPGYLLEGNVPQPQVEGIQGIGWEPIADVQPDREPLRPQEVRCFDLLTKGGEPQSKRQDFLTAEFMCDLVFSFQAITEAAGPQLSTVSFRSGFHAVGTSYEPVTSLSVDLSRGRVDGVSTFRPTGYSADCSCLRYLGPEEPMP
jgi:ABC-type branched-subunit amino acid transport system substrate-binding protein